MMRDWLHHPGCAAALLFAVTFAAYSPAFDAGFIWDDDDYVTENPVLRTPDGLAKIWLEPTSLPQWYPLTHTTFWLEYRAWKLEPRGYHVSNVILHALTALGVYLVVRRLQLPGALLAAAAFALHPIHVESVAWVTERKNVLSGAFYAAALLAWLKGRPLAGGAIESRRLYAASIGLYTCALLSKTVACTLPAVILLLTWWKRGRIARADVLATLPLFVLGLAMALVTAHLESEHVLARGAPWDLSLIERCLVAGRAVWFYAAKLAWPAGLAFNYPRWDVEVSAAAAAWPLAVVAVLAGTWAARRRIGRGPFVAAAVFTGNLVPALGFIDVYPMRYSFVADHFQYLASAGAIIAVAAWAAAAARRRPAWRRAGMLLATLVLAGLATATWRQSRIYENLTTLWEATLDRNPESWLAHVNLGKIRLDRGDLAAARKHLARALELEETSYEAHLNLGTVEHRLGHPDAARRHYERVIELSPGNAGARNNLGVLACGEERLADGVRLFEEALRLSPRYGDALFNLGQAHARLGHHDEAVRNLARLLELDPGHHLARLHLARSLRELGRRDEALAQYSRFLRVEPGHAEARREAAELRRPGRPR